MMVRSLRCSWRGGRPRGHVASVSWARPTMRRPNPGPAAPVTSRSGRGRTECTRMSAEKTHHSLQERIHDELVDSVDEELELEIDDQRLAALLEEGGDTQNAIDRRTYFEELLRLQRELVKLQDWVVHQKLKVVVLF